MIIAARIRKIREVRGLKQVAVANAMKITQQAYSCLEQSANNARLDTLKRYCNVMNLELAYLVAIDIPVTTETLDRFGSINYNEFLLSYKKLEQKLEIFDDLIKVKTGNSISDIKAVNVNMNASVRRA